MSKGRQSKKEENFLWAPSEGILVKDGGESPKVFKQSRAIRGKEKGKDFISVKGDSTEEEKGKGGSLWHRRSSTVTSKIPSASLRLKTEKKGS